MRKFYILSSLILLFFSAVILFQEERNKGYIQGERNPEENETEAVIVLNINSAIPSSTLLSNYINTGLNDQAGAINCLVVSETDSNLLLAGAQNGGVWISHNAAHSWSPVNDTARSLKVSCLAQNHFRPNEFYYSSGVDIVEDGTLLCDIYRSVDYGQTFTVVNPVSLPRFGHVNKFIPSPVDANTFYALQSTGSNSTPGGIYRSTDNCQTFQSVFTAGNFMINDLMVLPDGTVEVGVRNQIYRSVSGDSGTFATVSGLPLNGYSIKIAFCKNQPLIQYCALFVAPGYDYYKSTDGGLNWSFISNTSAGYVLGVKPDNPDFIMAGSVNLKASTDGGLTWTDAAGGYDNRSINFDPHRSGKVYVTSDFGICTAEVDPLTPTSFTTQYSFDTLLKVQEIYSGDFTFSGSKTIQGNQDLGTTLIDNSNFGPYVYGGDGAYCYISKQDSNVGYFSYQGGRIRRSDSFITNRYGNSILNQLDADNNMIVDEGAGFIHPFVMNNANDSQLFYPTLRRLWRSTDRGNNWYPVSRPYGNRLNLMFITCTDNTSPIVYWSNYDSIFVFPNAARALPFSEFGLPVPFNPQRIFTHPDNDSGLFVLNVLAPSKIYYCANMFGSISWTDLATTFPSSVTIQSLGIYPGNDQVMIVGTKEGGLYVTIDGGQTWTKESNFPNVQVREIKIRRSDKKVFIFTYGRGTWMADFPLPLSINSSAKKVVSAIFPNPFTTNFQLALTTHLNDSRLEIRDQSGKLYLQKNCEDMNENINTEFLHSGIYYLLVFSGNELQEVKKIVKL